MPRIITGKAKGTKLVTPAGSACRPTSGRTKEALFSLLGSRVEGARLLDLFAGSGQIALEALSRGAAEAVLIERDRLALKAIKTNIQKTGLSKGARLLAGDYRGRLKQLKRAGESFDIIYVDPPWRRSAGIWKAMEDLLLPLLLPDGMIILESDKTDGLEGLPDTALTLVRSCQYGSGVLSFYQFKAGFSGKEPPRDRIIE